MVMNAISQNKGIPDPTKRINVLPKSTDEGGPERVHIKRYVKDMRRSAAKFYAQPEYLGSLAGMVDVMMEDAGDPKFKGAAERHPEHALKYRQLMVEAEKNSPNSGSPEVKKNMCKEMVTLYNASLDQAKENDKKWGTNFVTNEKGQASFKAVTFNGFKDKPQETEDGKNQGLATKAKDKVKGIFFSKENHVLSTDKEGNVKIGVVDQTESERIKSFVSFILKKSQKGTTPEEKMGLVIGMTLRAAFDRARNKPFSNTVTQREVSAIEFNKHMIKAAEKPTEAPNPVVTQNIRTEQTPPKAQPEAENDSKPNSGEEPSNAPKITKVSTLPSDPTDKIGASGNSRVHSETI